MLYLISISLQNQYASCSTINNTRTHRIDFLVFSYVTYVKILFIQVIEDMSIQANVPALAMEEVTNSFDFLLKRLASVAIMILVIRLQLINELV